MQWKDGLILLSFIHPARNSHRPVPTCFYRSTDGSVVRCQLSTGESIKLMSENLNTIVVGVRVCGRELYENMRTAPLYCYITSYYNYLR